jgi:hypothetical protein
MLGKDKPTQLCPLCGSLMDKVNTNNEIKTRLEETEDIPKIEIKTKLEAINKSKKPEVKPDEEMIALGEQTLRYWKENGYQNKIKGQTCKINTGKYKDEIGIFRSWAGTVATIELESGRKTFGVDFISVSVLSNKI